MKLSIPMKRRLMFLSLAVAAYLVTEFGRFVYRPWVVANGVDDFGLAGSIGNLAGILVQIFFVLTIVRYDRKWSYILAAVLAGGYVLYECSQLWLAGSTFDWNDIWATVIGYCIAVPLIRLAWRWFPEAVSQSPAMPPPAPDGHCPG